MKKNILSLPLYFVVLSSLVMVITASAGRGFSTAIQSLIVDAYHDSTLFSNTYALGQLTNLVVTTFIPIVAQYFRYKHILVWLMVPLVCFFTFFQAEVVTSSWLYFWCVGVTISITGSQIVAGSLVNSALPSAKRTTYLSIVNMFFNLFMAGAPLLVGLLGYGKGSYLYEALGSTVFMVLLVFSMTRAPRAIEEPTTTETLFHKNKPSFLEKATYGLRLIINNKTLMAVMVLTAINTSTLGSILVIWGASYANISLQDAATLPTIFSLGAMVLTLPIGYLADKIGLLKSFVGCLVVMCLCYAYLSLDAYIYFFDYVALFTVGGCTISLLSLSTAYIGDTFKGLAQITAATAGAMLIKNTLGVAVVYLLGESIDGWRAPGANIVLITLDILGAAWLIYSRWREKKQQKNEAQGSASFEVA